MESIREKGYRVDGLGPCLHTPTGREGIMLKKRQSGGNNVEIDSGLDKRNAISRYLFYLAFENSVEMVHQVTLTPLIYLII